MNNFDDMPKSVKRMSDLLTATLVNAGDIRKAFFDMAQEYRESEKSPSEEKRIEGRRTLFFYLTTIRHAHREMNQTIPIDLINKVYEEMCAEFGAGHLESNIINSLEKYKKNKKKDIN